jgi:hypothetical protein
MPNENDDVKKMQEELARLRKLVADEKDEDKNKLDDDNDVNDDDDNDDDNQDDNVNDTNADDDDTDPKDKNKTKEGDDDEKVTALKESLNALDKKYKEALKMNKAAEKKARDAEIAALKREGKELEALQKVKEDLEAELASMRDENTSLKRDQVLDAAMVGQEFKSERSRKIARKDIIENLVKGDDGSWSSKDGKSIEDYAASYFEDDENRSLFLKAKTNSGAGTDVNKLPGNGQDTNKSNSIFDLPQDQLIKRVKKTLGR